MDTTEIREKAVLAVREYNRDVALVAEQLRDTLTSLLKDELVKVKLRTGDGVADVSVKFRSTGGRPLGEVNIPIRWYKYEVHRLEIINKEE